MTRYQYRHGTLELRGGVPTRVEKVVPGDVVLSLSPFHDLYVEETETGVLGDIILRDDTSWHSFYPGEYVYVLRR